MKLVALALVLFAGIANADELRPADPYQPQPAARAEKRQRREMKRARRIQKLIRKYDLNHDGIVDPSEMPPRLAQKMQKLDRNGDGWLDANDVTAPPPHRR